MQASGNAETKREKSPRELALYALDRIEKGGFSNIVITDILTKNDLDHKDRALFSILVKGVTERKITLDYVISSLSSMPIEKLDRDALIILRMGIYQLMYMDQVPKYAAVNECVSMARKRSKGYINAILRNFIRRDCKVDMPKGELERMRIEYSAPKALLKRFCEIFGEKRACGIFEAFLAPRNTDICVNPLKYDRDAFIEKIRELGYFARPGELSPLCVKTDAPYSVLEKNFEGCFLAMDEASQLCGVSLGLKEGDSFLDTCSAPGSKTYLAAFAMKNKGSILSCDLHSSKLSLISNGAKRLGIDIVRTCEADAREFREDLLFGFDCVLCDVPCSGLGVIGGKPEIKYKDINEFSSLPKIQYDILVNSSRYVKDGGRLVYSTCTLLPEENEKNIERFLAEHTEFELEGFDVGEKRSLGMITLTPDMDNTDGFFIARMVKRK